MVVCRLLILGVLVLFTSTYSHAWFDESDMEARFDNAQKKQNEAARRVKSSEGSTRSLRLLNDDDKLYRLPNGVLVAGLVLPNGKLAPAYDDQTGQHPACVTNTYTLVKGEWDAWRKAINCPLSQSNLAVIENDSLASQVSVEDAGTPNATNNSLSKAGKYGEDTSPTSDGSSKPANMMAAVTLPDTSSDKKKSEKKEKETKPVDPNIYIPPPRNNSPSNSVAGVMVRDKSKFGIPIGTWIKGELARPVSSAESGLIEFVITESIKGKYQTLPIGTVIFSNKSINEAQKRLESLSVTALLPNGDEFPGISMRAYSLDKTAGLSGTLIRDREGELKSSGSNAALSALSAATPSLGTPAGSAINSVTDDLISNEKRYVDRAPRAIIQVSPQPVLLKVSRGF